MLMLPYIPELAETVVALERRYGVAGLRRRLLAMLASWIGYFLVVNAFVHSLNRVAVPVLQLPLGSLLAIQGTLVIFGIALASLARRRAALAIVRRPVSRN